MGRVDAFDIKGRVGFGIAQFLCILQRGGEIRAGAFHGRQDIVRGAVENAVNMFDRIGRRAFAKPLHNRNAACNRRLEFQGGALRFSRFGQRQAVMRDHRLVGGDQPLARSNGIARQCQRRTVRPADQFDHHINIAARCHLRHVVFPREGGQIDAAVAVPVARTDGHDFQRTPGACGYQISVRLQQADNPGANSAKAGQCNPERRGRCCVWQSQVLCSVSSPSKASLGPCGIGMDLPVSRSTWTFTSSISARKSSADAAPARA